MQLPSPQQTPVKPPTTGAVPSSFDDSQSALLPAWLRFVCYMLGLALIGLLLVSRTLSPDPAGTGTHEQLGLPPCGFKLISGIPCPSCGMTTAWALATRGQWIASAETNVSGFLMALLALPIGIWLLVSGHRGNWFLWQPNQWVFASFIVVVIASAMIQWAIRVQLF